MKKTETIKILSYLNSCYTNRFKFPKVNDENADKMMIEVWYDFLKYYEYSLITAALKKLIINHPKWPPTPGEIVKEAANLKKPDSAKITGGEAWYLATRAVQKYGYYNSEKGMDSLPDSVREAVRNFGGFASLCHSKNDGFTKNQFIKIYQEVHLRQEDTAYLPPAFKEKLLLISENNEV
jgi:hypothetical protein